MSNKKLTSEKVIEDLQDYISKPFGFVLLVGPNGRGKSYAAMRVYESLTSHKLPDFDKDKAWFINQTDLNMLFSEAHEIYGSAIGLLKQAYRSRLLVLDDLGSIRTPSPAFLDFIYAVIDKRWNEKDRLGTIITTNLNSTNIRKNLTDAVFSRLVSGRIYTITGPDRRSTYLDF